VEIPDLSSSSVSDLDDHVSVVDQIKVSAIWKLGDNVEVSLNVKSELLVELTLGWLLLILVDIDNSPSLVDLTVLSFNDKVSVFVVESSRNCHDLSVLDVGKIVILESEELPPSGVDSSGLDVVAVSIGLDFDSIVLPVVVSDCL